MSEADLLQRFLVARSIEEHEASDADVASLWEKALLSSRDARNPALALDNRYILGYQALLQMGTAVLAAVGYRTRGAQGHHAHTFMAISALEIEGLKSIDLRVNAIRRKRAQSAYEPGSPTLEQFDRLIGLVDATLPAAWKWLARNVRQHGWRAWMSRAAEAIRTRDARCTTKGPASPRTPAHLQPPWRCARLPPPRAVRCSTRPEAPPCCRDAAGLRRRCDGGAARILKSRGVKSADRAAGTS